MQQQVYDEMQGEFQALGNGSRRYTVDQKAYCQKMIFQYGIRATARILGVSRRTIQRWVVKYHIRVQRCPDWVFKWADKRRRRREFWARRGYY